MTAALLSQCEAALRDLVRQINDKVEEQGGEGNFYTGAALDALVAIEAHRAQVGANRPAGDEQQGRFADRPEKTLDKARNLVFALSSVLGQRTKDSDEVTLSGRQANDITTVCRAYLSEYDALERYGIPPQQEPKS